MHFIVCLKQVPEGTEVEIDPETGVLKREGADAKMNVYDAHALEAAVRLKEELGGTVTALTMGPPQAEAVLREAFMLGADQAYLLSDRAFAGADTLATSYTLAEAIRRMPPFDVIFCGMQTTDGDTAQVGPEIAELLGIPHVSYITRIQEMRAGSLIVDAETGYGIQTLRLKLPCLVTLTRSANQPRLPSYRLKQQTKDWPITVWSHRHLAGADPSRFGLRGSPTQVERIFPPARMSSRQILAGTAAELSQSLIAKLREWRFL